MDAPPAGNSIIDALSEPVREALASDLRVEAFSPGEPMYRLLAPVTAIAFPIDSVFSSIKDLEDGSTVEVCPIGHEGLTGASLALGGSLSATTVVCALGGSALVMEAPAFLSALENHPEFRAEVHRYARAACGALAQLAACNRFHSVEERCARWLLGCKDGARRNRYDVTHEQLAAVLGANRPAVTMACRGLAKAGVIRYRRGHVAILDEKRLAATACECYGALRAILRKGETAA